MLLKCGMGKRILSLLLCEESERQDPLHPLLQIHGTQSSTHTHSLSPFVSTEDYANCFCIISFHSSHLLRICDHSIFPFLSVPSSLLREGNEFNIRAGKRLLCFVPRSRDSIRAINRSMKWMHLFFAPLIPALSSCGFCFPEQTGLWMRRRREVGIGSLPNYLFLHSLFHVSTHLPLLLSFFCCTWIPCLFSQFLLMMFLSLAVRGIDLIKFQLITGCKRSLQGKEKRWVQQELLPSQGKKEATRNTRQREAGRRREVHGMQTTSSSSTWDEMLLLLSIRFVGYFERGVACLFFLLLHLIPLSLALLLSNAHNTHRCDYNLLCVCVYVCVSPLILWKHVFWLHDHRSLLRQLKFIHPFLISRGGDNTRSAVTTRYNASLNQ